MIGKVTKWKMTEEERLAYIEKYPIVPTKKTMGSEFGHSRKKNQETLKKARAVNAAKRK